MDNSFESKQNRLTKFYYRLIEFKKFTLRRVNTKEKKKTVHRTAKNLFNNLLRIYHSNPVNISDKEKEQMDGKYSPNDLLIKVHRFKKLKKEERVK